ncbi:MAG TPA: SH3 domain-containing protein [Saprospiraceae bacterium]|nr:SH3 domain-containing protein [Saprospiraceae bacterium]HMP24147.1 SH3 domain-containing protein [Saprospiraceae bacterium]
MSERIDKILPKFELIIIAVFFLGFMSWGITRCNATRAKYAKKEAADLLADTLTNASSAALPQPEPPIKPLPPADSVKVETRTIKERYTPLYAILDGVNVRSDAKINSRVIYRLKLHEEVVFLNEVTSFREAIDLGGVTTNEPWIKVRTPRGQTGWVYGGAVSYYKTKLEGVQ